MRLSSSLKVFQNVAYSRYLVALIGTTLMMMMLLMSDWHQLAGLKTIRLFALDSLSPCLSLIQSANQNVRTSFDKAMDFITTYRQLEILRQENANLKRWKAIALSLTSENKALRQHMNVVPDSFRPVVTARVLSYPSHLGVHRIIIHAGTNQGVEENQAVITPNGVIGRIVRSGKHASEVLLTTDRYSRIPVIIEPVQQQAILSGTQNDYLLLDHLEKDVTLEPGMNVFTSGKGGVFPAGLYLGMTSQQGKMIIIEPMIDWRNLDFVQILTHSDITLNDDDTQDLKQNS